MEYIRQLSGVVKEISSVYCICSKDGTYLLLVTNKPDFKGCNIFTISIGSEDLEKENFSVKKPQFLFQN